MAVRRAGASRGVEARAGREGVRRLGARVLDALDSEQDRWFLWLPVLFGAGIALYFALPSEPSLLVTAAGLAAALAWRLAWPRGIISTLLGGAVLAAAFGFAAAKLRADWVAAPVLTEQIGPVQVRGWVELVEPRPTGGPRLTLIVTSIGRLPADELPARVRIRVPEGGPQLQPGDGAQVDAILSPPAGPALPGGYDFGRTAWFQSLGAVGFARAPPAIDSKAGEAPLSVRARATIARVRQAIGARVTAVLTGETGAIANALITGERGGISDATNQAFRDSGLLHIMSISGLHMAIMAGAVFLSVRFVLALVPFLALRFPIKKWAAATATVAALGYLLISGASFPTVRSWIMISIMLLAVMLERPALALRNVALAALAILVLFPESLMDVSFQMSFAAVVALVAAYEAIRDHRHEAVAGRRRAWVRVLLFFGGIMVSTLVAGLAVAPFAAYHFHKSQQYALLANLIAIPICNIVVMPAALATLVAMPFGLEWFPLAVMGWGVEGMVWCARAVAALPGAVAAIPAIPTAAFALMVGGGLWLALWRARWRLSGLVAVVLGIAVAPLRTAPDVLVGLEGALVAVRHNSQGLSALTSKAGRFELARWLEHDGDVRSPDQAAEAGAFRCDDTGCVANVRGRLVSVVRHSAALRDDCRGAAVVIVTLATVRPCRDGPPVVTRQQLSLSGTHAIYFRQNDIEVETVAAERGRRPWTANVDAGAGAKAARSGPSHRGRNLWRSERRKERHPFPLAADEEP